MHGRTIHSAGAHRRLDTVRLLMFADFQQQRPSVPGLTRHPSSGFTQWWHDSRQYAVGCPTQPDMWASWPLRAVDD